MSTSPKGITPEQLRQAAKDLNLTVAVIAESTGIPKAYISEFRNEKRELALTQQIELRNFLEAQYTAQGVEMPTSEMEEAPRISQVSRPAILLDPDLPKNAAEKLFDLIEANRVKVAAILESDFKSGGMFGGEFSIETEGAIRELFGLLALSHIAFLMLQGKNLLPSTLPEASKPKTLGDWFYSYIASSPLSDLIPVAVMAEPEAEAA
ncbi:hypothetical protein ACLBKS_00120 [Hylemonella sp. W303a]|uniref:hypothetical protein n=1 Tax=Hylemonella sp. W303a TaxID=3389873 RepID=UPI00396AEFD1